MPIAFPQHAYDSRCFLSPARRLQTQEEAVRHHPEEQQVFGGNSRRVTTHQRYGQED